MTDNPYSAPLKAEMPKRTNPPENVVNFAEIICRWERFRIFYNLALLLVTLLVAATIGGLRAPMLLLETAVIGAVGANVLFFYGPVADGYLQWMGFRHPAIGKLIFTIGTTLGMLLAALTILSLASASFH